MRELVPAARAGLPVLGICNGFQILCEAHLLPGALTRNAGLRFIDRDVRLRIGTTATPWTRGFTPGQEITVVLKSGEGAYVADAATLAALDGGRPGRRALLRRKPERVRGRHRGCLQRGRHVVGLMPHPEHAIDPLTGPGPTAWASSPRS